MIWWSSIHPIDENLLRILNSGVYTFKLYLEVIKIEIISILSEMILNQLKWFQF